jgi:hypothetical protein
MQGSRATALLWLVVAVSSSTGCGSRSENAADRPLKAAAVAATPKAECGPGSRPETGIQGRVSREEHESGRSAEGYTCNTELVGKYVVENALGTVGGFKVERYVDAAGHDCAYYDTTLTYPTNLFDGESGVNVLDMSDPANPVLTARLETPAMLTQHESLVVNHERGLLAAVAGNAMMAPGFVDIYDISQDCRRPVLKSVTPLGVLGHESGFSPDGRTFFAASPGSYSVTALDVSDPAVPKPLAVLPYSSHGLSISADGNRAYMAAIGLSGIVLAYTDVGAVPDPNPDRALVIVDISEIQARKPNPQAREIARLAWSPMSIPQNAIPITIKGKPYLVEIDEFGHQLEVGAGRIIDISDETAPKVISNLRLEVHQPENFAAQANDPGAQFQGQGYSGHYCNVPSRVDPPIVACAMILSGLRVFDIRDPHNPKEVAYFNAPVYPRVTPYLEAGNYAMSSPSFVPERKEIWYSDVYSGFYAIRVTNDMWPDP